MKYMTGVIGVIFTLVMVMAGAWAQMLPGLTEYNAAVGGNVYDSADNPIKGATVVATCNAEGYPTTAGPATTGDDGEYGLWINCPPGIDAVTVTATYDEHTASSTGTLVQSGQFVGADGVDVIFSIGDVNVTLPEFPMALLPAMMSVLGVAFARKF